LQGGFAPADRALDLMLCRLTKSSRPKADGKQSVADPFGRYSGRGKPPQNQRCRSQQSGPKTSACTTPHGPSPYPPAPAHGRNRPEQYITGAELGAGLLSVTTVERRLRAAKRIPRTSASPRHERPQRVDCRSSTESIERQLNAAEPPPIAIDRTALTGHFRSSALPAKCRGKRTLSLLNHFVSTQQ